jgi:DNA mismatch endonuclease (patch repair protein)
MMERPPASSDEVRRRFEQQKRKDTDPEIQLRRLLHAMGLRYRINYPVPGLPRRTIDIAFSRQRLAVFVDGCYWHACPDHFIYPRTNTEWWLAKMEANRERDRTTDGVLAQAGWSVVRIWEHDLRSNARRAAEDVQRILGLPH